MVAHMTSQLETGPEDRDSFMRSRVGKAACRRALARVRAPRMRRASATAAGLC